MRKNHPFFFFFAASVIFLYGVQLLIKTEITPLGYFALYSDPAFPQEAYIQALPASSPDHKPVNIYNTKGQGFLMLEILSTRFFILGKSDHCNQMNHKLQRLGLGDNNNTDCRELEKFHQWFQTYLKKQGINIKDNYLLNEFGFKDGRLIRSTP